MEQLARDAESILLSQISNKRIHLQFVWEMGQGHHCHSSSHGGHVDICVSVSLDEVTRQYSVKSCSGYICSICGKAGRDFPAMKSHIEAIHFPSEQGYSCDICLKTYRSKHSLTCHKSTYYRNKIRKIYQICLHIGS